MSKRAEFSQVESTLSTGWDAQLVLRLAPPSLMSGCPE
jgi:hypothetical protein